MDFATFMTFLFSLLLVLQKFIRFVFVFFFFLPELDLRRHACAMGHYSCHDPFPVAVINKIPQEKQVQGERISQGIRSLKQLATVHS